MLMAIRDRFTGALAWAIVIIISVPFVFWGIQEYLGLGRVNYSVVVNGNEISNADYSRSYEMNRQSLMRSFGGKIPAYFNEAEYLQKQTLDRLIDKELLLQAAEKMGLKVGNEALAAKIIGMPSFQSDGKFDQNIYASQLQSIGLSRSGFESDLKRDLLTSQISQGISETAFATQQQLANYVKVQYQSRDMEYAVIKASTLAKNIEVSDDDISKYYTEHLNSFVSEETVKVEFIELNIVDLKKSVTVTEDELRKRYDDALSFGGYSKGETRDASHILVRVPQDSSDEVISQKQSEIDAIKARLEKGESFVELAKALSEDPGSAKQGGSLSTVERGVMVRPFEDALYALTKEGEFSDPVRTTFGFHIIKLEKINAEEKTPFADVKDVLEEEYRQDEADKIFYELSEKLANVAFENETSLAPAAAATGLNVQNTELFTRLKGAGVAAHEQVRNAAFSEEVLQKKYNSELIEIAEGHVVALRIQEHQPSVQRTLDESRGKILTVLEQQRLDENISLLADEFVEAAKADGMSEALAKKYQSERIVVKGLKRDNRETPFAVVDAAFKSKLPGEAKAAISKVKLRDGSGYAVIAVTAINDGDIAWIENEQKSNASKQLESAASMIELTALVTSLKSEADIQINPELQ